LTRFRLVTASARTRPDLISGTCGGMLSIIISISPASSAAIAGPAPRNGMWTMKVFVIAFRSSLESCGEVP